MFVFFPKTHKLKLFGNCRGNSYIKFLKIDIKFHFTCGKLELYQKFEKFQNIMNKIAGLVELGLFDLSH